MVKFHPLGGGAASKPFTCGAEFHCLYAYDRSLTLNCYSGPSLRYEVRSLTHEELVLGGMSVEGVPAAYLSTEEERFVPLKD